MTTWLDRFVVDAGREVIFEPALAGGRNPLKAQDPLLMMLKVAHSRGIICANSSATDIETAFDGNIVRRFLDQGGHCDRAVAAFQIDRQTANALERSALTDKMANSARNFLGNYLAIYFDFSNQALMLGDDLEISALILESLRDPKSCQPLSPRIFAVIAQPGKFSRRLVTWLANRPQEILATDELPALSGPPLEQPLSKDILSAAGLTSVQLARKLTGLADAACWMAATNSALGFSSYIRRTSIDDANGMLRTSEFLPEGLTLFNVARIDCQGTELEKRRVILIDPYACTIKAIDIARNLDGLQAAIGGSIALAQNLKNGDILYVDDNGLFNHRLSFKLNGEILPGRGLIVGPEDNKGRFTSAKSSAAEIDDLVSFSLPDPNRGTNRVVFVELNRPQFA